MSERDVYHEPPTRVLLRTADAYQTESMDEVAGYSEQLLSIVADYRNGGRPEGFNAQAMVGKSKRGEVAFRLFARVNPATRVIEAAGFKTRGCLAMTGCASVTCTMIEGRTLQEALALTTDEVRAAVGGVPAGRANTLAFSVEAVRALVGDFLVREGAGLEELDAMVPCDLYGVDCLMCEHCSLRDTRNDMLMKLLED
ncbi:iron-sulfur cluster assembly scaffold protein [Adlercreutzia muris]|uniref:iron-sulfur cluster assembly scaffold protein n=1 Tax=Adlercreutzia muris TaxID=1796610 RepID=UPI001F58314C|nr:iron-sulfur cluster assembly scaffold protein [Adlercreutzia muris]